VVERYIVFADVDETLIRPKSMIAFMNHFLERPPFAARPAAAGMRKEFLAMRAAHTPSADRAVLNRLYYAILRGVSHDDLERAARAWIFDALMGGDLFIPSTYDELMQHKKSGAELVLVSGSFAAILSPIRAQIAADALLCTELEVIDGVHTGRVLQQVIGDGKWEVIRRYLNGRTDVRMEDCYAYGDHVSDICFMEKVGHQVVVGDSTDMLEIARQRNWRVLPVDQNPRPISAQTDIHGPSTA